MPLMHQDSFLRTEALVELQTLMHEDLFLRPEAMIELQNLHVQLCKITLDESATYILPYACYACGILSTPQGTIRIPVSQGGAKTTPVPIPD